MPTTPPANKIPKGLAHYMEGKAAWATPERCQFAQEERAKGTPYKVICEMLDRMPGPPMISPEAFQRYCQRKAWTMPGKSQRTSPHSDDRGLWKTPERIDLLIGRRRNGVRLEDIRQEMNTLPGPPMPTLATLRRYCCDAGIIIRQESNREEPGWEDPTIPDKEPPTSRKCLRCSVPFRPNYFGQWMHPNCRSIVANYDDTTHSMALR